MSRLPQDGDSCPLARAIGLLRGEDERGLIRGRGGE